MATSIAQLGAPASKIGIARERYAGWLDVRRTMSDALDSYRTEHMVEFAGGWSELRRFAWSAPLESVWHTDARCYFLSLALDGTNETRRRNVSNAPARPAGEKRVLVVPPGQTISSMCAEGGRRRSLRCLISADLVEAILPTMLMPSERAQLGAIDFGGGAIEWLLFRMFREISNAEIGTAIAIESIAREIAVEIARTIQRRRPTAILKRGGLPAWRMRLILDRIHADAPLPAIGELASLSGMTVRHLGRAFQAETGRTLGKFIASAMAERAGRMLEAEMPVGAVAAALGYARASSFAHAFTRETGLLPSRVRAGAIGAT